jgi:hypothetical protein
MPIGVGLFPAGLFPAGFGVPETAAPSPNSPLPDPSTGISHTGRFINQQTKDYVVQSDGRLQGMPTVAQLVLIAVQNIDFSPLREKGPHFAASLKALIAAALAPLVAAKQVRVRQIVVLEPNQDAGLASVDWIDLTNGAPQQTVIGASS